MRSWQLQEAKAHLSEVVREATRVGPQQITLRGEPAVVVITKSEYDRLKKPKPSFYDFIRQSPLVGEKLDVKRNRSKTREVDL